LDSFGDRCPEQLGGNGQSEIDPGCDASAGDDIAVDHHTLRHGRRAKGREHVAAHPMGRSAASPQKSGCAQNERPRADTGCIPRIRRLAPDEFQRLIVIHQRVHATASRHADEVQSRTDGEGCARDDLHSAARCHWSRRFGDKMHPRLGKVDENLIRAGQIELGDGREKQQADLKCHCYAFFAAKRKAEGRPRAVSPIVAPGSQARGHITDARHGHNGPRATGAA
jgi:hypothetical protein